MVQVSPFRKDTGLECLCLIGMDQDNLDQGMGTQPIVSVCTRVWARHRLARTLKGSRFETLDF